MTSPFYQAPPRIQGSIPTLLSGVLVREPDVRRPEAPRMTDFGVFITAAELALGWHPFNQRLDGEGIHRGGAT